MHEWWLSQGQACKKVACGSRFWERKFWERWESVLIRNMSNSHHKILFQTQNDLFAGLPKYNTTIITIKQTNQCDFMDEFLFNNKCSTSNDFVSFQIFNNYRVIGSWTRVLKCQILWKKKSDRKFSKIQIGLRKINNILFHGIMAYNCNIYIYIFFFFEIILLLI